ncbi:MAG: undecaprenyl/decaprenyl-phosphate alpha-N-acetylglucosaminyl 1-phosphate transferase [Candidatus Schekmanbacteria bacterium]|nr:MAG: undecaprenyl/decaprenyl-phosphate alpha-N-acetylglucosaminyl 1-phosphate transferase [Candidatus Schekmanbacteria bacterium]
MNKGLFGTFTIVLLFLLIPKIRFFFNSTGIRWIYILLVSLISSYLLTPIASSISYKKNFLDIPNETRKIHSQATPLLGGFAVYLAFLASLSLNNIFSPDLVAIISSVTLIMLSGLFDIKYHLPASVRLFIQLLAVAIVIYAGVILKLFPKDSFLWYFNIPLTILWIVGITNSMNFFDGMDGLAAGLSIIISAFLGFLAFQNSQPFLGWVAIAMIGGCLGFLPYNFRLREDASIFLGDSGSNFLGFTLACMAIQGDWSENSTIVSIVAPLFIFSILIYDMIYITVERIISGKVTNFKEWIEYVGKDHLHHRMNALLTDRRKTVLFIYLINIAMGCSALALRNADNFDLIILVFQGIVFLIIITILERLGNKLRE